MKTIRLFVSSTFRDMHAERDHLNRLVFPEIRKRCHQIGAEFIPIDLRWGITAEQARGSGALTLCLQEIDRCRPFFLGLMGERYGWVPLPEILERTLFEQVHQSSRIDAQERALLTALYQLNPVSEPVVYQRTPEAVSEPDSARLSRRLKDAGVPHAGESVTEQEIQRALEGPGRPEGTVSQCLFYLREPGVVQQPGFPENHRATYVESEPERQESIRRLRQTVASLRPPHRVRSYQVNYAGLRVEAAYLPRTLSRHSRKALADRVIDPAELEELEPSLHQALTSHGTVAWSGLETFGQGVLEDLWAQIESTVKRPARRGRKRILDDHARYLLARTRLFVGREAELARLTAYARPAIQGRRKGKERRNRKPTNAKPGERSCFVVSGAPGSGKSSLLAEFARRASKTRGQAVISHFIGAVPGSTDLTVTLRALFEQLRAAGGFENEIPDDPARLRAQFGTWLEKAGAARPVLLILDALNQLDPRQRSHELDWLPIELPENVRVVVSALPGRCLDLLQRRVDEGNRLDLAPMNERDRAEIVRRHLALRGKQLGFGQLARLLDTSGRRDAALPLYLLVALEELCLFGEYEGLDLRLKKLPGTIGELFDQVLARLELDHGLALVQTVSRLLAASRSGLTESEVLDLLGDAQTGVAPVTRLEWMRFYRAIEAYLNPVDEQTGAGLLNFFHDQLRFAVMRRYLRMEDAETGGTLAWRLSHRMLSREFSRRASLAGQGWRPTEKRALGELPFHLARGGSWEELARVLGDLRFVEAKCAAGSTYELVADYEDALDHLPDAATLRGRNKECVAANAAYVRALTETAREATGWISDGGPPPALRWRGGNGRMRSHPAPGTLRESERLRLIRDFSRFVSRASHQLARHAGQPGFVLQHAFNSVAGGGVGEAAERLLKRVLSKARQAGRPVDADAPLLMLSPARFRPPYVARPVIQRTFAGRGEDDTKLAMTPDGRLAVSTSVEELVVWDVPTGEPIGRLRDNERSHCVALSADGSLAFSGSGDQRVRVWDVPSGACLKRLSAHQDFVIAMVATPDGRTGVSGSQDGTCAWWNFERGELLWRFDVPERSSERLALSLNGQILACGGDDGAIRVFDLHARRLVRTLRRSEAGITMLALTEDGRRLFSNDDQGRVRSWDVASGKPRWVTQTHDWNMGGLALTPRGGRVVAGGMIGLHVLDGSTGRILRRLASEGGSVGGVTGLAVTADGNRALSASYDGELNWWDLAAGERFRPAPKGTKSLAIRDLVVSPDGRSVACVGDDGMEIREARTGRVKSSITLRGETCTAPTFTTDGSRVVAGSIAGGHHGGIVVADLRRRRAAWSKSRHDGYVSSLALLPNGRFAISGSDDGTIRLWDLVTLRSTAVLKGERFVKETVAVGPDGCLVLSALSHNFGKDQTVYAWDLRSRRVRWKLAGHEASVYVLKISPDGRMAASAGLDDTIRLWDLDSGKLLRELPGHPNEVKALAFTDDGARLISAGEDRMVKVWDVASGRCLSVLAEHYPVSALSVRGSTVAMSLKGGVLKTLELHDANAGPPIVTAVRAYSFDQGRWEDRLAVNCRQCGVRFEVPSAIIARIEASQGKLAKGRRGARGRCSVPVFSDESLRGRCPRCDQELRYNPFVAVND